MVRRLLLLNGMAVLTVLTYHASGWGYTAMFWWADRFRPVTVPNFDHLGGLSYLGLRTVEQFLIFGIPAFLFVSGYFIAFATKKGQATIKRDIIASRIKVLLIPYLLWSAIILIAEFVQGADYSAVEIFRQVALGRVAPPYYYIPLLIQLYLLAPLVVYLAKKNWRGLLLVVTLIHLVIKTMVYLRLFEIQPPALEAVDWVTASWFFPGNLLWFSIGVVIGFHIHEFKRFLARIKWAALAVVIVFLPIGVIEWELILRNSSQMWIPSQETFLDNIYSICFIFSFLAFENVRISFAKFLSGLAPKSYGVYLVHSPVLEYTARGVYHLVPVILGMQFIFQPLLIAVGLGIPLLLMWLLNQTFARRYYQYVFG